jgi:hypothetical protein
MSPPVGPPILADLKRQGVPSMVRQALDQVLARLGE